MSKTAVFGQPRDLLTDCSGKTSAGQRFYSHTDNYIAEVIPSQSRFNHTHPPCGKTLGDIEASVLPPVYLPGHYSISPNRLGHFDRGFKHTGRCRLHDYLIYELAMLQDGKCCVPIRWFTRDSQHFANCWEMVPVITDEKSGWRVVIQTAPYTVPATNFFTNFPQFQRDASLYIVPSPTSIFELGDNTANTTGGSTRIPLLEINGVPEQRGPVS
ncbi:hypothetical protein B0H14DRAFT_2634741 [Mycena olivaceomarginata]|nr:hypothetical protein B0H14DRAFT_2634741 [Mycena olivaceomarginata]